MPHSARRLGSVASNPTMPTGKARPNSGSFRSGACPAAVETPRRTLNRPAIQNKGRPLSAKTRARPEPPLLHKIGDPFGAVIALDVPILALTGRLDDRDITKY